MNTPPASDINQPKTLNAESSADVTLSLVGDMPSFVSTLRQRGILWRLSAAERERLDSCSLVAVVTSSAAVSRPAVVAKISAPDAQRPLLPDQLVRPRIAECSLSDSTLYRVVNSVIAQIGPTCTTVVALPQNPSQQSLFEAADYLANWAETLVPLLTADPFTDQARDLLHQLCDNLHLTVTQRHAVRKAARDASIRGADPSAILDRFRAFSPTNKDHVRKLLTELLHELAA